MLLSLLLLLLLCYCHCHCCRVVVLLLSLSLLLLLCYCHCHHHCYCYAIVIVVIVMLLSLSSSLLLLLMLPEESRCMLRASLHVSWNIGRLLVTLVWILVPPSENWTGFFTIVLMYPVAMALFIRLRGRYYESPRWLAVSGNYERCLENLKYAASSREDTSALPPGWDVPGNLRADVLPEGMPMSTCRTPCLATFRSGDQKQATKAPIPRTTTRTRAIVRRS